MQHNEVEGITQGSLVLIPESFEEHWSSSIDVMDLSVLLPGEYAAGTSSWSSAGRVESIPNDDVIQLEDNNDAPANLSTEEPTSLELKGVISVDLPLATERFTPVTLHQWQAVLVCL